MKKIEFTEELILKIFTITILSAFVIGFEIGGIFMVTTGVKRISSTRTFLAGAVKTEGVVAKLRVKTTSSGASVTDRETFYYSVIEFTPEGADEIVRFTSSTGSSTPMHREGEKVTLYYQPDSYRDARLDSFFTLWGFSIIIVIFGIFTMIFSVAVPLLFYKKVKAASK